MCFSFNAHHNLQVRSIGCSDVQNGCQLHYHTADSVLTSGCSNISQYICIKICVVQAILGRCVKSKTFSTAKRCMWKRITGRLIDDLGSLSSGIVTSWGLGPFRSRMRQLGSWLSGLVSWRCTSSFASPACLRIVCSAIFTRIASSCVFLTKYSQVSFYCCHHLVLPRKLNTLLLLFSDLRARLLDQILHFLYCGVPIPSFVHFG